MKRLFLLLVLIAGFVGLGWVRGWFQISSSGDESKTDISVSVDRQKIQQDKEKAVQKVEGWAQQARNQPATQPVSP